MPRIQSWLPWWLSTSVAIRVTSSEDLQLTSTRPALRRLLMICNAYEVVVDIWVSIPCIAGAPFRRINEKLGAETGDLAMTYKLVVAAVGLCRHAVRIGDGFSWNWSNGNELWDLVVVRNLFATPVWSRPAVGQQFVDREESVFHVKMAENVQEGHRSGTRSRLQHHQLRAVEDNADGNGSNTSVQSYAVAVHSDHRGTLLRRHFFGLQGTQWMQNSAKGASCTSTPPQTPSRTTTWQCATRPLWCHRDDYLASDLFMPGARLMQYGLSDHNAAKHRWC